MTWNIVKGTNSSAVIDTTVFTDMSDISTSPRSFDYNTAAPIAEN